MTDEITEGGAAGAPSKRQSWLIVPPSKRDEIEQAARSGADVLVLDLAELLPDREKSSARHVFRDAIAVAKAAGAEVFAQIDPSSAETDLRACVWPGLAGVVISRAESAAQVGGLAPFSIDWKWSAASREAPCIWSRLSKQHGEITPPTIFFTLATACSAQRSVARTS